MTAVPVVIDINVCLDLFVFEDPRSVWLMQALCSKQMRAISNNECREEWLRVLVRLKLGLLLQALSRRRQIFGADARAVCG